jgi:hypothetical protein
MTSNQLRALRLIEETHNGVSINGNTAKALERKGYVTIPEHHGWIEACPRITEAGREALEAAQDN